MRKRIVPAELTAAAAVHVIAENGVYAVQDCIEIFRLRKSTIRREVRAGRLRVAKRAGRYFLLGEWLLEWLRGGELTRTGAKRGASE
jgi:hypothetical protein